MYFFIYLCTYKQVLRMKKMKFNKKNFTPPACVCVASRGNTSRHFILLLQYYVLLKPICIFCNRKTVSSQIINFLLFTKGTKTLVALIYELILPTLIKVKSKITVPYKHILDYTETQTLVRLFSIQIFLQILISNTFYFSLGILVSISR